MAHNLLYVLFLALPINKDSKGLPLADTVQGWHCIFCGSREVSLNRPSMRPSDSSLVKYSETTAGCSRANPMLTGADQRQMLSRKQIQNPYFSPLQTYRAKALSGYRDRAWAHTSTTSGVETGCSTAVAALTVRREKSRQRRSVVYVYCQAPPTVWRENDGLGFWPALHYRSLHACCTPGSISYNKIKY